MVSISRERYNELAKCLKPEELELFKIAVSYNMTLSRPLTESVSQEYLDDDYEIGNEQYIYKIPRGYVVPVLLYSKSDAESFCTTLFGNY